MADQDKFAPKLDHFPLEMEDIEDTITNAIIRHEFPYRDGAMLDNLGQKAREIKIRCYWYEDTYDTHKDFLAHLAKKETFELIHPKYGLIKGQIETVSVKHDDRTRTAEVDISFVEGLIKSEEPVARPDIVMAAESQFTVGQEELITEINAEIAAVLGPEGQKIIGIKIIPDLPLAWQLTDLSTQARAYLQDMDNYIAVLDGASAGVLPSAVSLLSLITYPTTVAGRLAGALAQAAERVVSPLETLRNQPTRFLGALRSGLRTALRVAGRVSSLADRNQSGTTGTSASFVKPAAVAAAQRLALETAAVYRADEPSTGSGTGFGTPAFDDLGHYIGFPSEKSQMTIGEIESTLDAVRGDIQDAVNLCRGMDSLKKSAETLLQYVNTIKLERDKITRVEIPLWMPMHLICLRYGLPHTYAERIHRINKFRHPSYIPAGEVQIYVR